MSQSESTLNVLIAALGGEGGGVLTQWLLDIAEQAGWHCQSTSLAGVAQRTGATIYYLEFMPRTPAGKTPVMSLFPSQGDIDLAVTSEWVEAGRMMSRGFISPDRTVLVSSSHRVYGIDEKTAVTDGTADTGVIETLADRYAQRVIQFDMDDVVKRHGTVISAGLLGAIAGSEVLPFELDLYRRVLGSASSATANHAAFEECLARAQPSAPQRAAPAATPAFALPRPSTDAGERLLPRIEALPQEAHELLYHGTLRLIDYQDVRYAELYLSHVERLHRTFPESTDTVAATARWLALWMAYEDIPRVAQLKLRPSRFNEIRQEVQAKADQPIHVTEFFHPRVEEVAALMPRGLGRLIMRTSGLRRLIASMLGPRKLRTDTVIVRSALAGLAALRRMRRHTLGFDHEYALILRWYDAVLTAPSAEVAEALAACGQLVKGYGATRHRTTRRLMAILDATLSTHRGANQVEDGLNAEQVQALYAAAIDASDDSRFDRELATLGRTD